MSDSAIVDVVIPVYRPGSEFLLLIERLKRQSYPVNRCIIMETESSFKPLVSAEIWDRAEVYTVTAQDFDHGNTRNMGILKSSADYVLCMTQDAMPADDFLLEKLISGFSNPNIAIVYGRQLPAPDCRIIEKYTRQFNYPDESMDKSAADMDKLGIKTFFCSNVCAMYKRDIYTKLGGFPQHTIFNEDMIFASAAIKNGYHVYYCAEASVIHSHNYSGMQQLHRNFDMAVSQAMYPDVFSAVSSEKEGISLVKKTCAYLCKNGKPWWIIYLFYLSGMKYIGYFLGKRYKSLPKGLVRCCSMNKHFWDK